MEYYIILPRNKEENKIYRGAVSFILNVSQVGDEKADYNILAIVQTALVPDTVKSYSQENVKNCPGSLAKS